MSSNIVSETIDAEFPVAGQDNDTQGFRDNFSTIKDSLAAAKTEIEELQDDTAKLNTGNNFAGNDLSDANFVQVTEEFLNNGTAIANVNVSFLNGHYQVYTIGDAININFTDWPESNRLAKMRIELVSNGPTMWTLTFSSEGGGTILYSNDFPSPFSVENATDRYIVDVWTFNNGNTVYMAYVGMFS